MADGLLEQSQRTALYRHFAVDSRLLYVGISLSPIYRLAQHCDGSQWFEQIAAVKVEWFDTREAALDAEKKAIQSEQPEYNIVHKIKTREAALAEMTEESCFELVRKVTRFGSVYNPRAAADACGISVVAMRLAMMASDIPYFSAGSKIVITGWALISYLEALQAGHLKVRKRAVLADGRYDSGPSTDELIAKLK